MRRHSRHDQRFKTVLEVFFGDLLRIVVPEFADLLLPEKARPANKELFTALPEGRRFMLAEFLDNYLQWSEEDEMAYQEMLEKPENRDVAEAERSWFGRARVEGREEGWRKGLEKGLEKGRRETLRGAVLRVLERRFGEPPDEVVRAVEAIESSDELNELLDRAATASDLDDVRSALG